MFNVKVTMPLEDYEFMLKLISQLGNENGVLRSAVRVYQKLNAFKASIDEFVDETPTFDKVFKKGN